MGPRLEKYFRFQRFDIISAGVQLFTERFASEWVGRVIKTLEADNVALAGGLFMNVKLNKIISEIPEVKDMFVFPSCGDESSSIGVLYKAYYDLTNKIPEPLSSYYLGGEFTSSQAENAIKNYIFKKCKIKYTKLANPSEKVAELLSNKKIVARHSGRMEFGARALGNRSILANPSDPTAVKTINKMIKNRDFWMPFAPSMTQSERYLINPKKINSPYMIMAFDIKKEKSFSMMGAIHPYDESCRPQVVTKITNPEYFALIEKFNELTGESVILNTSFNLHGFPVVYKPEDALFVFDNSGLEYLLVGDILIEKIK